MNVYSRFGGKDGVVEHLFIEGFRRLGEAMNARRETNNTVADLRACGRAYRAFAIENRTLYSVMFDKAVPDFVPSMQAMTLANSTLLLLAKRIDRAMKANALRKADPMQTAALVWATCHGVVSLEMKSVAPSEIDWARIYEHALEMIIKGLS
jgi:AcrR family transcriptional regulator